MSSIFEKLNLKEHCEIVVVNPPPSFEAELTALEGIRVLRDLKKAKAVHFALVFAVKQTEVDSLSQALADKAQGDALLWFAYPKGTSKNYQCDFNRDTGWSVIRRAGFDTVRAVAIDEDWSALRFRRVEFIKPAVKKTAVLSASFKASRDVVVRTDAWKQATEFYASVLGLPITHRGEALMGFETGAFCLYLEKGEDRHGPVFEFLVHDVQAAKRMLLSAGCSVLEEDASVPRCYIRDPYGVVFNLGLAAVEK
ncbi:MAG: hypothetical protein JWQ90_1284 [Hydrocarboniphaga sp.]|uniref:VOC family protein n=1 Tax=Hydrocarboniphaga sp. TaxID=2033016 RepID=UPI00261CC654|nr:VOC family protein [Hydrocarboniphaga sp.]MDB5968834.1 hypothetical protein [Hydrocarboniphaga sp.]